MATDLTSVAIKDGFSQLLHCDGGLASTETAVLDGDGTSSTLSLGTGSATIAGNLVISGNLTVSGTTTEINTQTLNVADNIVVLNNDVTGTPSQNAGIEVERGTSTNTLLRWNESSDRWQFTNDGSTYYNIPISTEYNNYTLPTASSSVLGGIKVGTNLSIDGNGVLSASGSFTSFTIADSDSTQAIGDGVHIKFAASNSGAYGNSEISGSGTSQSPYVITLYAPDTDNNTTDLNTLSAGTINTANDSFGFIDADDSNASKKESIADFLTAIAGSGISASSGQLSRDSMALNQLSNVSSATPSTGQYLVYGGSQWEPTSVTAMTSWYLKDGDTTAVQVTNGKYVKFVEGNNLIDINFTDTDSGAVDDEFDVTFTVNSSNITSLGTITSGTWNGGVIASAYLDADTAHLSGSTFTGNIGVSNTGPQITLTDTNASNRYGSIYYGTRAFLFDNILNSESLSSVQPYIEFRFATAVDGTYSSALKLDYDLSATFGGAITAGHNSKITSSSADTTFAIETTSGTSIFPVLNFISSHSSAGARIRVSGSDVISIDKDQDVTFADDVHISGNLTVGGTAPYLTGIANQSIKNLQDVASNSPSNGQILQWNSTANYYEPVTFTSSYSWYLRDGDTTAVEITSGKYVKLVEGTGIDINFTDTDSGAFDDEFDVTITNTLMSGGTISGDLVISDYESKLTLTKTRNTTQSFHIAHENDDGVLDFLRESTRTARITENGRWVIGGHTEVDSSQLSVQGNLGVTGLAYFKYGSSSNDNVRFYNQDGSYSYIRVTADGNNANTWFDTKLGSTTWFGWSNTGGSGVSSWHFGTGGSTGSNSVLISSGAIIQYNSSGSVSTTLNADGSATFGGRINVTEIRGSTVAIKDSNADLMAYFQDGSSRLYSNGYNLRLEYSNELNLYNGNSATTLYLSHNGNGSSTNISNSELIVTNGSGSTFNGVVTYSTSSGTIMSRGGFSDFIGYNSNYGTYIGGGASNASRYIYAGGYFYDGSSVRTLYHTGNLSPITTSNIGSQSVSYASNSGTLSSHDTRNVTTTPQTINAGVKFDFKTNSTNGLNDGSSYHGLMTYRQYGSGSDWSGGHAHQIGFTDNTRLYHRSGTGTSWNTGWYKIHTQRDMPNSGYNGVDVTLRTNSNGYLDIQNWINVTSHGIYSSNINGFHFLPNQVSDYGVARLIGTRSGYSGINYNNKTTLMMGDDTIGLYNDENNEWICYGNRNGNFYTYFNGATKTATYINGQYFYGNGSGDAHLAEGNSRTLVLQTSRNSSEFHVGENAYTYGNMSLRGSSNSYQGIVFPIHNDYPTVMFENSVGSGGFYYQGSDNKWAFFWHNGNDCAGIGSSTTSSSYKLYVSGGIYATGDVVAFSDARVKTNVVTIDNPLDKVLNMRGVYYNPIDKKTKEVDDRRRVGVIAQELNKVLPEAVTYAEDVDEYGVDYGKLTGVLIEAIKELKQEINELKKGCCNGS